jgi:hypothetical protein
MDKRTPVPYTLPCEVGIRGRRAEKGISMRKLTWLSVASLSAAVLLTGCASVKSPVSGFVYTDIQAGEGATSNAGASKIGQSEATSILGWVATGDASIDKAAKSAGITKIHHVDYKAKSILGFYAKYTTVVYGE